MPGQFVFTYIVAIACVMMSGYKCTHTGRPTQIGDSSHEAFFYELPTLNSGNDTGTSLRGEVAEYVARPPYGTTDAGEYVLSPKRISLPIGMQPMSSTLSSSRQWPPESGTLRKPKQAHADKLITRLPVYHTSVSIAPAHRNRSDEYTSGADNLKTLYIGGLFALSNANPSRNDKSELAAAELALRHINEQRYVRGYQLELVYNDTKVCKLCAMCLNIRYNV